MKNIIKFGVTCAAVVASIMLVTGAGQWGNFNGYAIQSVGSANTNLYVTNVGSATDVWPTAFSNVDTGATIDLSNNLTAIAIPSSWREVSLQFTCAAQNTSTSNVTWKIGKSGASPGWAITNITGTNSSGAPVPWDVLGYVTNTLNSATPVTTVATYSYIPRTVATAYQSTDTGIAGCSTLYVVAIGLPALTCVTNYSVYVNGY